MKDGVEKKLNLPDEKSVESNDMSFDKETYSMVIELYDADGMDAYQIDDYLQSCGYDELYVDDIEEMIEYFEKNRRG